MRNLSSIIVLALLITAPAAFAQEEPIVNVEWIQDTPPAAVNPWAAMEEKERADAAEIKRLRSIVQARRPDPDPVRPTPSVMVRGTQAIQLKDLGNYPIQYDAGSTEPDEKPRGLVGPSMGWNGPRKEYTHRAGTHMDTWTYLPNQKSRR